MSFLCRAKFKKFIQGGGDVLAALLSLCVLAPRANGAEVTERLDIGFGTVEEVTEETTYHDVSSDDYGGVLSITKGFYEAQAPVYFLDNKSNNGGAISYMNGTLNFLDIAVFERNSAGDILAGESYGHGGAIYMTGGSAYFGKAATFNDNSAYYGGAIYTEYSDGTIEFKDKVTFKGNEVRTKSEYKNSGRGGAVYNLGKITVDGDADFISNIADADGGGGGAIYNKGTFTVKGETLFQGNESYYGEGGAIYNTGTVKLGAADKKTTFKDNLGATGTVYNDGGGFYVEGDLYAVNNTSRLNGGGFLNLGNGGGEIKGFAQFENNEGPSGGAIYITNPGFFTFSGNATFTGNKATSGNGGAIYNVGTLYFRGSSYTFKDNTAKKGTVKNDIYNTGTITIGYGSDSTTDFNASYIAGTGTVKIEGAVNLNAANDEKTIEWSNLLNISSGAVLNVNDVITLSGGPNNKGILVLTQSGGKAVFRKTATFKNNNSYHGGAIYAGEKSDGVEFVGDAIFESNHTYSQTGDSTSDIGGAIYNVSAGDFIIGGNATFKNNTATQGGGGIYNEGTFIIKGESLFYKNQSYSGNGGAIYNKGGSMTLGAVGKKTTFENNMGSNGIVFNTGDFTILGDVVSVNNQVRSNDGGFIDNRGTARVNGTSTLTDNTASGSGGAISNRAGATLTLVGDADFLRNKANDFGGAVRNEGVLTLCGNAVFEDNRLIYNDTQGGAIYNTGTINFQGASYTFANNLVKGGGFNDIFNAGGTLNIGVAGGTTDFGISYVTGRTATASAILFGTVNLKAANAAKTIDWLNNRVEVSDGSVLNIENTVLFQGVSRSDGTDGAAMFIGNGSKVTVAADAVATFDDNEAYQAGGAVHNKGVFTADGDVIFTNNTAMYNGGAVYNEGTFTVKGEAVFRGNKSNYGHGSAIYNKGVVMLGAADKKTTFDANTGNDATVYNEGSLTILGELAATGNSISSATGGFLLNKGTTQINGYALITDNYASSSGGAIYNEGVNSKLTFLGNADFLRNSNTYRGGAISNEGVLNFKGTSYTFKDNKSGASTFNDIYNSGTMNIGAAGQETDFKASYVTGYGYANIFGTVNLYAQNDEGTISWQNHINVENGAVLNVKDIISISNSGSSGYASALYVAGAGSKAVFDKSATFKSNRAYHGGAIYAGAQTDGVQIAGDAIFESNSANSQTGDSTSGLGGAIYNVSSAEFVIGGDATFKNNHADNGGGAIYNEGALVIKGASLFQGNTSYRNGGAIYNRGVMTLGAADKKTTVNAQYGNYSAVENAGGTLTILGAFTATKNNASSGCGGALKNSGGTVRIDGFASFTDNSANSSGGALYNENRYSKMTLAGGAEFLRNSSKYIGGALDNGGTLTIANAATFTENTSAGDRGGAVHNTKTISFNGTASFTGNTVSGQDGKGGAAFNDKNGVLTFSSGASFTKNTAKSYGGAIYNNGTVSFDGLVEFNGNTATTAGGAVYNYKEGTFTASAGATFTSNTTEVNGGAAYNDNSFTLNGGATFTENSANGNGGAIYNVSSAEFIIGDGATFEKNSANNGGAIYNLGTTSVSGTARFEENTVSGEEGKGGAIYNGTDGVLSFADDVFFNKNEAKNYGGAVYNNGTVSFNAGAKFENGSAGKQGGAIYNNKTISFNETTSFTGNTVSGVDGKGGAIYNGTDGVLTFLSGVSFSNNTVSGEGYSDGGAVYNKGTVNFGTDDKRVNLTFEKNTAKNSGGAVFNVGGVITVKGDVTFTGDTTAKYGGAIRNYKESDTAAGAQFIADGDATFTENEASLNGGAISNSEDSLFSVAGNATFEKNTAGDTGGAIANMGTVIFGKENNASSAIFSHNTAQNGLGGAIFNYSVGTVTFLSDATFTGNTANANGGAIYNAGTINFGSDAKRVSLTFTNNTAKEGGNAIFNTSGGVITIKGDAVFSGDPAVEASAKYGGAIRNYKADGTSVGGRFITEGTAKFYDNKASWGGGALSNNTASLFSVSNGATFERNKAGQYGGAIYNKGEVSFGGLAEFNENSAARAGGAVYNYTSGTFTADAGAKFVKNTTGANGGAVYNDGSFTLKGGATFTNNTANANGGAVYNYSSGTLFMYGATFKNNTAAAGGALYNLGTINFNGSSYKFENNKAGDSFSDIVNNGTINAGAAGEATSFDISFVSGSGSTDFKGDVTLNATQNDTIYWQQNAVRVLSGASLNIGKNMLDAGGADFTSEGTLKLTLSGLTDGSSDFTGGRLKTTGTATIGGTLFVTIDPSVSLTWQTGELLLAEAGTYTIADDLILKISDGYTISYIGDGKFVIGKQGGTPPDPGEDPDKPTPPDPGEGPDKPTPPDPGEDPDKPTPPDPTPRPTEPEDTRFVKPAKQVAIADVRAGVVQITDRLSTLGAPVTAMKGRSGGAAAGAAGEASLWAKALYTTTDLRGRTKMDSDGYGFIVGADGAAGRSLYLGAALGYTRNKGDTDLSHFKSETYLGYLYGRYALTQDIDVAGTLGYGLTRFDLNAADKKFNAHTINAQAIVSYALPAHLTAEVGGRYTFSMMDAYTTGSTEVAAEDTHTATALAGLRYRRNFGGFVLKASAGVLYDVYSDAADYRLTQSGVASFAQGERLHRFGGEGGVGFGYEGETFGIEADYNAQVRKDYNDQTVSVKMVYRFGGPKAKKNTNAKVVAPAAPAGGARGTTLREKSKQAPVKSQIVAPAAPEKRLQVSSFKKKKNARKQYRHLSGKYPELKKKKPDYKRVNVKGMGKRVRTYVKGEDEELHSLCKKMRKDLKDTCLISKNR